MKEYEKSGVSIKEGEAAVQEIKSWVKKTERPEVLSSIGSFGGLFDLNPVIKDMKRPILVSSIDGVGTKLKIAFLMDKHDTIGQDIVNHCIDDILVQGAFPLFFMDYIGTGKLSTRVISEIVKGMAVSCEKFNCTLLGGETAEMPGFYQLNEYDIAGCIFGILDYEHIITGEKIQNGDIIVGLPSSGLHTNGYSLARRVLFEKAKFDIQTKCNDLKGTIGEELLKPHRCYLNELKQFILEKKIHGMAHITGGGFEGNIKRILPETVDAVIQKENWDVPAIFQVIQKEGAISEAEMYEVFNMGIGMVIMIHPDELSYFKEKIDELVVLGEIVNGSRKIKLI